MLSNMAKDFTNAGIRTIKTGNWKYSLYVLQLQVYCSIFAGNRLMEIYNDNIDMLASFPFNIEFPLMHLKHDLLYLKKKTVSFYNILWTMF